ncbi:transketolase family protein [Pyrobaculum aerophilum]|uniref:2-oxoacid oxidoreductase (ferredoxin) n=2 Tax=Pyrobaculum aerophilum TaxID=13773 RepID=Q8ZW79_PYRAE|nr:MULTISPECIES: transketolase family protein [Pyrobaculum]AAL63823.1 transketolase (C terminal section) [Pyrobaculum aerophilum str. IM2]MCX8136732.1 transketolase family protein [Pyrobaculum aerophilum]HII46645.1 transketolase family protein [Pyrobaculum aerophilum]
MLDIESLTPREALGKALADLGDLRSDVVVLVADTGETTRAKLFAERHPERFFNVGIAEQSLVGIAAGLALAGFMPYALTFAAFMTRGWEQARNSVDRLALPVRLVGTHAGFADAYDGPSHQALEDIALFRVLPNFTVMAPADSCEVYKAVTASATLKGPAYIRVGRDFHIPVTCGLYDKFEIGKAYVVLDGSDVAIFTTGVVLPFAIEAAQFLKDRGISAAVVHFPTIKPLDYAAVEKYASVTGAVLTVEEHMVYGGFGSAIAEYLSQTRPTKMAIMGLKSYGRTAKSPQELYQYFGLTPENIAARAEELVKLK